MKQVALELLRDQNNYETEEEKNISGESSSEFEQFDLYEESESEEEVT